MLWDGAVKARGSEAAYCRRVESGVGGTREVGLVSRAKCQQSDDIRTNDGIWLTFLEVRAILYAFSGTSNCNTGFFSGQFLLAREALHVRFESSRG